MKVYFLFLCNLFFIFFSLLSHGEVKANATCVGDLTNTIVSKDYESNALKLSKEKKLSAQDVLARLIFSEGLATGCLRDENCNTVADFKNNILIKIGWGIAKRFKTKANYDNNELLNLNVYETVFKKMQFRTSFTPKIKVGTENIYAEAFLCPEKLKKYLGDVNLNYLDLLKAAHEVAAEVMYNPIIGDYRFVTNFYYPRSPVFGELTPGWAKAKPIISNKWIKMYNLRTGAKMGAETTESSDSNLKSNR